MGKVREIGIFINQDNQILNLQEVEAIAGKGLVNDTHFKKDNDKRCQITLIEIENINHYNKISGTNIQAVNFRRNIVTEGIKLNDLIAKEFFIGKIKVKNGD